MIVKIPQKIHDVPPWIVQFDINKTNPISKSRITVFILFVIHFCIVVATVICSGDLSFPC